MCTLLPEARHVIQDVVRIAVIMQRLPVSCQIAPAPTFRLISKMHKRGALLCVTELYVKLWTNVLPTPPCYSRIALTCAELFIED